MTRAAQARVRELLAHRLDAGGVVVGRLAAAQDDVAVLVAGGVHDRRVAALGDRQEVVRRRRGLDRVDRDPDVAVGAVLEADGARQSGRELAMDLAFGRARADGAPRDQVGDVLRRDHVEVLGPGGQVELVDLEQDAPREAQAFVDAEAVVEARIVDEPLPADRRARLLEVDAHHDDEAVGELVLERGEARRVVDGGIVVVDRAGSHDDEQPVVGAVQHAMDRLARLVRGGRRALRSTETRAADGRAATAR